MKKQQLASVCWLFTGCHFRLTALYTRALMMILAGRKFTCLARERRLAVGITNGGSPSLTHEKHDETNRHSGLRRLVLPYHRLTWTTRTQQAAISFNTPPPLHAKRRGELVAHALIDWSSRQQFA